MSNKATPRPKTIRCAIYTRKSTEEGLDQQYNSLDSQRDAGESYIRSQANEGWELVPDRYDDGGFSGGNIERPALKRMMEDIQAGKIDCVVVYKVDRLSRSLLDFARVMETFDKFSVSFVSVNAQANGVFPTRESHWYRTSRNHGRAIGPSDQGCRRLVCQAQSWS